MCDALAACSFGLFYLACISIKQIGQMIEKMQMQQLGDYANPTCRAFIFQPSSRQKPLAMESCAVRMRTNRNALE
jgi:hypothetical protein